MKKLLVVVLLLFSSSMLSGCMPEETLTEEELQGLTDPIAGFLMEVDGEFIHIDITKPFVEYAEANDMGYEDFAATILIKRTESLEIVNIEGEALAIEDIKIGSTIYVEYNVEDYGPSTIKIEREKLVVD